MFGAGLKMNMPYFGLIDALAAFVLETVTEIFNSVSAGVVIPAIERLMNGIVAPLVEAIWGAFIQQLFYFVYNLFVLLLFILDIAAYSFDILIGTQPIMIRDGNKLSPGSLFEYIFFNSGAVTRAFWAIAGIACALTIAFSIWSIVRSMMDLDVKRPVGKILGLMSKSLITFLLIPAITISCLNLSTLVLTYTSDAITGKTDGGGKTSIGTTIYSAVIEDAARTKVPTAAEVGLEVFANQFVDMVNFLVTGNPMFLMMRQIDTVISWIFAASDLVYDAANPGGIAPVNMLGKNGLPSDIKIVENTVKNLHSNISETIEGDEKLKPAYSDFQSFAKDYINYHENAEALSETQKNELGKRAMASISKITAYLGSVEGSEKLLIEMTKFTEDVPFLYKLKDIEKTYAAYQADVKEGDQSTAIAMIFGYAHKIASGIETDKSVRLYVRAMPLMNNVINSTPEYDGKNMFTRLETLCRTMLNTTQDYIDFNARHAANQKGSPDAVFKHLKRIEAEVRSSGYTVGTPSADALFREKIVSFYANGAREPAAQKSGVAIAELTNALGFGYMPYLDSSFNSQLLKLENVHSVVGIICTVSIFVFMIMAAFIFVRRIFEIMLLYIVSPYFAATMPLDDGQKFKAWRDMFIAKMIAGFGIVIAMRVYLMLIPVFLSTEISFSAVFFVDDIIRMLLVIMGSVSVLKGHTIITQILSPVAYSTGAEAAAEAIGRRGFSVLLKPVTFAPNMVSSYVSHTGQVVQNKAFNLASASVMSGLTRKVTQRAEINESISGAKTRITGGGKGQGITNVTSVSNKTVADGSKPGGIGGEQKSYTYANAAASQATTLKTRAADDKTKQRQIPLTNPLTNHNNSIPPQARKNK